MYCSNCGKKVPGNLNYCSACGAPTENNPAPPDGRTSRFFVMSGTIIVVFGFIILFSLIRILVDNRFDPPAVAFITTAFLLSILLMFAVTMVMAWKNTGAPPRHKKKKTGEDEEYRPPASFRGVNTAQLPEGDPAFGSVIDSTTRTLDKERVAR